MDPKQKRLYTTIENADDLEIDLSAIAGPNDVTELIVKKGMAKMMKLQRVLSRPQFLGVDVPNTKLEWLNEYLEDNPHEVVVVFTLFRDTALHLHELYKSESALIIGGDEDGVVKFQKGGARIAIGTIAAMNESLNLQRARTAIFLENHWSNPTMTQALDRIHRIDITEPKHVIHVRVPHTVDQDVADGWTQKHNTTQVVYNYLRRLRRA